MRFSGFAHQFAFGVSGALGFGCFGLGLGFGLGVYMDFQCGLAFALRGLSFRVSGVLKFECLGVSCSRLHVGSYALATAVRILSVTPTLLFQQYA